MLRVVLGLASALAAASAQAGTILYATAATTREITSYCVRSGGGLEAQPLQRVPTTGNGPSRLIVLSTRPDPAQPPKQFLYAAQSDRVQVWRIGNSGNLTPVGRIPSLPIPDNPQAGLQGQNSHDIDIAISPDGSQPVLYIPQRAFERIAAFPLDPDTGLSTVPTGFCASGVACTDITECGAGESCIDRKCVSGPACAADGDCGAPGACRQGVCLRFCDPRATDPDAACGAPNPVCGSTSDGAGSSCVNGPAFEPGLQDLVVGNGLLYASRGVTRGDVRVYQLAPDGNFAPGFVLVQEEVEGDDGPETVTLGYPFPRPGQICTDPVTNREGEVVLNRGQIEPYSRRRRLNGSAGLVAISNQPVQTPPFTPPSANAAIDGIFVSERFRRAIAGFDLCPSPRRPRTPARCAADPTAQGCPCTPPPPTPAAGEVLPPQPADPDCPAGGFFQDGRFNRRGECTYRYRQPQSSRTKAFIRYNAMALAERTTADAATGQVTSVDRAILGAQFLDGRIDGYRLRGDDATNPTLLPRRPTRRTKDNFRTSPFRLLVYRPADVNPAESAGVVYVGAGDSDRVQAYRLDRRGLPRDKKPFSETTVLRDTFPNDVVVVELPDACR